MNGEFEAKIQKARDPGQRAFKPTERIPHNGNRQPARVIRGCATIPGIL